MAEWSNAAVLKTVVLKGTGGSNPSLSAVKGQVEQLLDLPFLFSENQGCPIFLGGGGFFFFFLEPVQLQTNSCVDFFYIFASGVNRSAVACVFFVC